MKHFKTYLAAMALALSGCQSATDSCETTENCGMPNRQKFGWNLYLSVMGVWEL